MVLPIRVKGYLIFTVIGWVSWSNVRFWCSNLPNISHEREGLPNGTRFKWQPLLWLGVSIYELSIRRVSTGSVAYRYLSHGCAAALSASFDVRSFSSYSRLTCASERKSAQALKDPKGPKEAKQLSRDFLAMPQWCQCNWSTARPGSFQKAIWIHLIKSNLKSSTAAPVACPVALHESNVPTEPAKSQDRFRLLDVTLTNN